VRAESRGALPDILVDFLAETFGRFPFRARSKPASRPPTQRSRRVVARPIAHLFATYAQFVRWLQPAGHRGLPGSRGAFFALADFNQRYGETGLMRAA